MSSQYRSNRTPGWLGIANGSDFDPAHFDPHHANRRIDAAVRAFRTA